jgi:hypothetical protein
VSRVGAFQEALEVARELRAVADKPNLEALCDDIRVTADALPVGNGRRMALESVLAAFSPVLRNDRYADVSRADADAFRVQHEIQRRAA